MVFNFDKVRLINYFLFLKFLFIYWERGRERQREQGRGRERGRHGIRSRLRALSCPHRARRGARPHELWDLDLSQSGTFNWLCHPGSPDLFSQCQPEPYNQLVTSHPCLTSIPNHFNLTKNLCSLCQWWVTYPLTEAWGIINWLFPFPQTLPP